jgi:hypothetical protein
MSRSLAPGQGQAVFTHSSREIHNYPGTERDAPSHALTPAYLTSKSGTAGVAQIAKAGNAGERPSQGKMRLDRMGRCYLDRQQQYLQP